MSQQKVDARKEAKKNRKETIAREKRNAMIGRVCAYLAGICIVAGIGYSVFLKFQPVETVNENTFYYLTATDSYGILDPSLPEAE